MNEIRKITMLEIFGITTLSSIIPIFLSPASTVFSVPGSAVWLSGILSFAAAIFLFIALYRIVEKHPGKNIFEICILRLGKGFAKLVFITIFLVIILSVSDKLFLVLEMLKVFSYPTTSKIILAAVILSAAAYAGYKGIYGIGKTAKYVSFLLLGILLIVLVVGLKIYKVNNIFPLFGYGTASIANHSILVLSGLDNFLIAFLFLSEVKSVQKFKKAGLWSICVSGIAVILSLLGYCMAISYKTGGNGSFGILDIVKDTQISTFFQRFESIVIFFIIVGILVWSAIYLAAAHKVIYAILGRDESNSKMGMIPLAFIVFLIGVSYQSESAGRNDWLSFSDRYSVFFMIAIILLLWIAPLFKRIKTKKQIISAFLVLIIITTFSGCSDYREIEQEAYAIMIGYDLTENDQLAITFRFMDPGSGGKDSMNPEQSSDKKELPSYVYSVTANSLNDGIVYLGSALAKSVSLVHTRMVVFSSELAQRGLTEYIKSMSTMNEIQNSLMLLICNGKASDFVSNEAAEVSGNITTGIEMIVNDVSDSDNYIATSLSEFWNAVSRGCYDPSVAYGAIAGNNEDEEDTLIAGNLPIVGEADSQFAGTALFNRDKLADIINTKETAHLRMVKGELKKMRISLSDGIVAQIKSRKHSKISVDTSSDIPKIDIVVYVRAGFINDSVSDVGSEEILRANSEISDRLKEGAMNLLEKTKSIGADIFDCGGYAARNFATIQEFEKYNWKEKYSAAQINITVNVKM